MKAVKINIIYNRRNKLNSEKKAPLSIELYQGGSNPIRKVISAGIEVKEDEWNDKTKTITTKCSNHLELNSMLKDKVKQLDNFVYDLYRAGDVLTEKRLDDFLNNEDKKNKSFIAFFEKGIDPLLKHGTKKEHTYTLNILKEFRKEILFSEINLALIKEFDLFMHNYKNVGLMQNTIAKHHQHVKRFLRQAYLNGLFDDIKNPYHHFTSKKERSNRIALTQDELKALENLEIGKDFPELQLTRDMFLFSCFTGLRFSDIDTLEKSHILKSNEGLTIVKVMEKVSKPVTLPLSLLFDGKPLLYYTNYKDFDSIRVFPKISNQHINRSLKTLAITAKIPMRLTFHIARHTFGTMLADISQNPYLIMDLMGHSKIETSMIYIHRSQELINKQLRVLNWDKNTPKS